MDKDQFIKLSCLSAKALGFTNSIINLSHEERNKSPSKGYGDDYNNLRSLVRKEYPELDLVIPPQVTTHHKDHGGGYCSERYSEIYTYSEQIYQMLDALIEAEKKYNQ